MSLTPLIAFVWPRVSQESFEMFKTEFVRDGDNHIIGNETRFDCGDVVVRDRDGRILGRTSSRFRNVRDDDGRLTSRNTDDAGLLFRR